MGIFFGMGRWKWQRNSLLKLVSSGLRNSSADWTQLCLPKPGCYSLSLWFLCALPTVTHEHQERNIHWALHPDVAWKQKKKSSKIIDVISLEHHRLWYHFLVYTYISIQQVVNAFFYLHIYVKLYFILTLSLSSCLCFWWTVLKKAIPTGCLSGGRWSL